MSRKAILTETQNSLIQLRDQRNTLLAACERARPHLRHTCTMDVRTIKDCPACAMVAAVMKVQAELQ